MSTTYPDYDTFARLNPVWPPDSAALVGRRVRLNFQMENALRQTFVRDTVMRVRRVSGDGGLDLTRLRDPSQVVLYGVPPMCVQLEGPWYNPCLDCEGIGHMLECSPSGSYAPREVPCRTCKGSQMGRRANDPKEPT